MGMIYFGVRTGLLPPLIFLGIGALTDFSALLSNPRRACCSARPRRSASSRRSSAALQSGSLRRSRGSIGIIGGADGPTAIFLASRLAPSLIGPIAIAAYSYMAMVPIIQPPIMKLLTTREERLIRMQPGRKVSQRDKMVFPIAGMVDHQPGRSRRSAAARDALLRQPAQGVGRDRPSGQERGQCTARHLHDPSRSRCRRVDLGAGLSHPPVDPDLLLWAVWRSRWRPPAASFSRS